MRSRFVALPLVALLLGLAPVFAESENDLEGSVTLIYRNVSQDGESRKYDEDIELGSGVRLGDLAINWLSQDPGWLDYARLEASGLGGDPEERTRLRIGRKDVYELSIRHDKWSYVYDLFDLVDNEDGARWDAERRRTDINLKIMPRDHVDLIFRFEHGQRDGSSLFMKDLQRNVFRLETPLDQQIKRYTVGANWRLGDVNFVFRQTLRRYDNQFDNSTEGNSGLEGGPSALDSYEWVQNDSGGTDLTTLRLSTPIGDRVDVSVGLFGTFFGDEEIKSRVHVDADGTTFSGSPFSIRDGFSRADLEGDTTMVDADVSVDLIAPLTLHVQYRSMDHDLSGTAEEDLEGQGTSVAVDTRHDYQIDTSTVFLEYRPMRELSLRAGYRLIDRQLNRNGFVGLRNTDYDSGDDDTVIFGLNVRPAEWFKLSADFEDGEIDQPFNAVAPQEREHQRIRATFTPMKGMRIDLARLDFDNSNRAPDLREVGSLWDSGIDGTTWSASFWHNAGNGVDCLFRYSEQDIDSSVGVTFDQAGFGAVETGDSIFNNDNTQFSGRVNLSWAEPWTAWIGFWIAESDGHNILRGDGDPGAGLAPGDRNDERIDQEFANAEIGLNYKFPSGLFVGGSLRDFDYDDVNNLLDYDGQIFEFRVGTTF